MTPTRQRRQAHRQRKALARALHHVRAQRRHMYRQRKAEGFRRPVVIRTPKYLRKHAALLRHTLLDAPKWFRRVRAR